MDVSPEPKLIRKIGFGYAIDGMPAPLLLGFHQLSKKIEQAGFKVKVVLVPLDAVSSDLDLLFVPTELAQMAAKALSPERIVVLEEFVNPPAYTDLITRLQQGTEISALRQTADDNRQEGYTARYRGYERIE